MENIAVYSWRLRRLLRCESGQIARALVLHKYDVQHTHQSELQAAQPQAPSTAEIDSATDHLFLPAKEDLEKLLRYEATMNRQIAHAISELERLQRRRKGELVPAPISVDISGGD